jgi:hypothetical protein
LQDDEDKLERSRLSSLLRKQQNFQKRRVYAVFVEKGEISTKENQ